MLHSLAGALGNSRPGFAPEGYVSESNESWSADTWGNLGKLGKAVLDVGAHISLNQ